MVETGSDFTVSRGGDLTAFLHNPPSSSPTTPALTYFVTLLPAHANNSNGRIWLSYRAADKSIRLGYRVDNDPTARDYATYDLSANARIQVQSSKSPAICVFQDKLYIAWKPDNADVIKYQRTDGEGNWESNPFSVGGSNVSGLPGPYAPALGVYGGKLYLAWLAKADSAPYDIWFTTSSDGSQWTTPGRIQVLMSGSVKFAIAYSVGLIRRVD